MVTVLGILRLYTFIEWVNEMKNNENTLRTGPLNEFHDKVFVRLVSCKMVYRGGFCFFFKNY